MLQVMVTQRINHHATPTVVSRYMMLPGIPSAGDSVQWNQGTEIVDTAKFFHTSSTPEIRLRNNSTQFNASAEAFTAYLARRYPEWGQLVDK